MQTYTTCPLPGDLPDPGSEPASLVSPTLAGGFFKTGATWEALCNKHILWHDDCLLFVKWEWIVLKFLMLIVFTLRRLSTSRKWKSWPCDLRGDRGKELEEGQGGRRGSHTQCSVQFSWVAQSCLTLHDPMDCSRPGLPVHHQLLEFTQTHVHQVSDAIQPSHPLSSPSSPAFDLSQHQGLFQWVSSSHQVAKVLES